MIFYKVWEMFIKVFFGKEILLFKIISIYNLKIFCILEGFRVKISVFYVFVILINYNINFMWLIFFLM